MAHNHTDVTVLTIGHSSSSAQIFLDALSRNGVEILVDVRTSPYSRFAPHYNRESLRMLLKEKGIRYTFAGHKLGGRPTDPSCYKGGVLPAPGADYLQEVDYIAVENKDWYQEGIHRLIDIAANEKTVIMCSEENPDICHRHHLISRTLMNRGVAVWHIRQNGNLLRAKLVPQQTGLFSPITLSGTS